MIPTVFLVRQRVARLVETLNADAELQLRGVKAFSGANALPEAVPAESYPDVVALDVAHAGAPDELGRVEVILDVVIRAPKQADAKDLSVAGCTPDKYGPVYSALRKATADKDRVQVVAYLQRMLWAAVYVFHQPQEPAFYEARERFALVVYPDAKSGEEPQ